MASFASPASARAQTVIELLLVLGVSLIALGIIYSLYSAQIESTNFARESVRAKSSIESLVNAANSLRLSGSGSKARVLVDIPETAQMQYSSIQSRTLSIRLSSGSDAIGVADVNFSGAWKQLAGQYVTGGYYASLVYDGNVVSIYYDDFDLSTQSISVQAKSGSVVSKNFSVRNNSTYSAPFTVEVNFPNSPFATIALGSGDDSFTLAPGESRVIDFNISLSSSSFGNYAGKITVTGTISDGVSSIPISKDVFVSAEAFYDITEVMIYPASRTLSVASGSSTNASFSICNSSSVTKTVSWSKDSNRDANMLTWFSVPPSDSVGVINDVNATSCRDFNLLISAPSNAASGLYDANFTATYNGGANTSTSYLYASVTLSSVLKYLYFSSFGEFDTNTSWTLSKYFRTKTTGDLIPTGELDWNMLAINTCVVGAGCFNGQLQSDNNLGGLWDSNLIGLWHFNDKNGSEYLLNSVTGVRDANLNFGSDVNESGLWDTNAGFFDGNKGVAVVNSVADSNQMTYSFWFNAGSSPGSVNYMMAHCSIFAGSTCEALMAILNTGAVRFLVYRGVSATQLQTSPVFNDGRWHQVVGVINNAQAWLYVDGTLLAGPTTVSAFNAGLGERPLSFGSNTLASNNSPYRGDIEEAAVWSRALSASDVNALYVSQKGKWLDGSLVAYYKFNDKNGSVIFDSAMGNNGTLTGRADVNESGLWDTNAGFFDGVNSYVNVPDSYNLNAALTGNYTLSMWTRSTSTATSKRIFSKGIAEILVIFNYPTAGRVTYYTGSYADVNSLQSSATYLNDGRWHNLVFMRDNNVLKMYVDTNFDSNRSEAYPPSTSTAALLIGVYNGGYYQGALDEIKLFGRALTQQEISSDYNKTLLSKYSMSPKLITATSFTSAKVNSDLNYSFGGELDSNDTKFYDVNLIGLWHLNDKNSTGWVLNSVTGIRDGNLKNGADVNEIGLWDTNAGFFDGNTTNGSNDTVAITPNTLWPGTSGTISAWVKAQPRQSVTSARIFETGTTPFIGLIANYASDVNRPFFYVYNGSAVCGNGSYGVKATTVIVDDKWHHLVGTYGSTGAYIYVDGVLQGSFTSNCNMPSSSSNNTFIGDYRNGNGANAFKGVIDEVALWNRALTSDEVAELFRKGAARLDLNFYSCNDSNCNTVNGSLAFTKVKNKTNLNISSLAAGNYFKYTAGLTYTSVLNDNNYVPSLSYYGFPFVSDLNVYYSGS